MINDHHKIINNNIKLSHYFGEILLKGGYKSAFCRSLMKPGQSLLLTIIMVNDIRGVIVVLTGLPTGYSVIVVHK